MAGYNVEVIMGGTAKKSFDDISDRLRDGTLHCVIGTKVLNENVDIPPLDCLHLPLPSANDEMEEQQVGRIRRPDGPDKPTPLVRAYCYGGHKMAKIGEYTRQRVYTKLGFIDGQRIEGEAPLGKQMDE